MPLDGHCSRSLRQFLNAAKYVEEKSARHMPCTVRQGYKLQWHAGFHPTSISKIRGVKTNAALWPLNKREVPSAADAVHDRVSSLSRYYVWVGKLRHFYNPGSKDQCKGLQQCMRAISGKAHATQLSRGDVKTLLVLLQWTKTVIFFAGAMAVASAHRVTFSVLAVPLQRELGLSLPQMGVLQSAVLAGYILGQVIDR